MKKKTDLKKYVPLLDTCKCVCLSKGVGERGYGIIQNKSIPQYLKQYSIHTTSRL